MYMIYIAAAISVGVGLAYHFDLLEYLGINFGPSKATLKSPNKSVPVRLKEKIRLTHNTYLFRFNLPDPHATLGLPIGKCIFVRAIDENGTFSRAYTPVSMPDRKGEFDLVVKIYFKCDRFPNGGRMSQYLYSMHLNEEVSVRGPFGTLCYVGYPGRFEIKRSRNNEPTRLTIKKIGLIAGGSGITPMYQMLQSLLADPNESIEISLVFANSSLDDLILYDQLTKLEKANPDKFKVVHVVSNQAQSDTELPDGKFVFGFINKDILQKHLPENDPSNLIALCGPPLMISEACMPALNELGYDKERIYLF